MNYKNSMRHHNDLVELRDKLEQIGDEMADLDFVDFDQDHFDQVATAFHAVASIVGYPETE